MSRIPKSALLCSKCATTRAAVASRRLCDPRLGLRLSSSEASRPSATNASSLAKSTDTSQSKATPEPNRPEPGPMARRLMEATEDALFTGGRAGRRAVEEAGFSEELKERLLAKVQDAKFRSDNAAAFAEAGMPDAAGQGTRFTATSAPWTGSESTEDAVLRMLNDARKPLKPGLRGAPKLPDLKPVDMRIRRDSASPGRRAAGAREKAAAYSDLGLKTNDIGLTPEEREAMRQEFRERFKPAARSMPATLTGLASLANERIEDAIARGQFKNIPRGKGVERDPRSDNPFVDTTEYIMNKMIKRQDIVPPWIEKQQELLKTAHSFRTRLRNDWKRHAARMIASKGGTLQEQMSRAQIYALAEELHNPRKHNVEQISVPTNLTEDPVMVKVRQQLQTELASELSEESLAPSTADDAKEVVSDRAQLAPLPPPFRDPDWLRMERSYMDLAIANLNTITRSYNLMAPELAKKPYFSLERELNNCYADVAPQLADAIKERAARPAARPLVETIGHRPGGILDRFGKDSHQAKIHDSKAPHYGFKEMWKDFFSR
ncbi:hypothetical protein BX600DRAFT_506686 [Xylariales sp. PMI_506]|nr:hypothetical protein BX600DRAFT_506686 [Xylariales sp. PMI_506]